MRLILATLITLATIAAAQAEEVVAGLSRDQVSITANFDGSDILIYGAVKRFQPAPETTPLEVIITVRGPRTPVTVRQKEKRAGIWVNTESIRIPKAPSFYAVSTTGPLSEVLRTADDALYRISVNRAIRLPATQASADQQEAFREALVRIRSKNNLYQTLIGQVTLYDDTLFSTKIDLPANLVEGDYTTKIFLTRGGIIIDEYTKVLNVEKVGLERWIYNLAHERPLAYGILSLFIAISAGWLASSFFRYLRF